MLETDGVAAFVHLPDLVEIEEALINLIMAFRHPSRVVKALSLQIVEFIVVTRALVV